MPLFFGTNNFGKHGIIIMCTSIATSKSVRGRTDRRMSAVALPCTVLADRKWTVGAYGWNNL